MIDACIPLSVFMYVFIGLGVGFIIGWFCGGLLR